jgi:hypothetical protein
MAAAVEQMTVGIDEIGRHAMEAETISSKAGELERLAGGLRGEVSHFRL